MSDNDNFCRPGAEQSELRRTLRQLVVSLREAMSAGERRRIYDLWRSAVVDGRDPLGGDDCLLTLLHQARTALLLCRAVAADAHMVTATLTLPLCQVGFVDERALRHDFGDDVARLVRGLVAVAGLYGKRAAVLDENFQKLLLTFADDIRVIIIMTVDRVSVLRHLPDDDRSEAGHDAALEARYLYAPLAHRLGLYQLKTELEDLSLKRLNDKVYNQILTHLTETKAVREQYVVDFMASIRKPLEQAGLRFSIKGRTKSINSIWEKMKRQGVDLSGIFDLFAIRVILDSEPDREKRDCWTAYSIVTDIYTANTSRLRDWVTLPKSNGYESLHITVLGPQQKWVEVQIRTRRMDEVAERGLAAHWRYKGIAGEQNLDRWMNNVRQVLEAGSDGQMELIRSMHMSLYEKEVFVFTPRGDLFRLPQGATVLDFAFAVHTRVGQTCVGAKVDGKTQKINYRLKNGDTVEVLTSSAQTPKQDWLAHVVTAKARACIRQALNDSHKRRAEMGKELLQRRFKNRKIDLDEATVSRMLKRLGYKTLTEFYAALHGETLDFNRVVEQYEAQLERQRVAMAEPQATAEQFVLRTTDDERDRGDILVIGDNVKGINYRLSRCCDPIYGDKIVGFVASDGAIKIHRADCKNLRHLRQRYPYRIIRSAWSGKIGTQFAATLRVVGKDKIGIVSNITSVINKMGDTQLRSVSIVGDGSTFEGHLVVGVSATELLDQLIGKLQNLHGIYRVERQH